MPQFLLPVADRPRVSSAIGSLPDVAVHAMDVSPLVGGGGSWTRYKCETRNARAILVISEHPKLSGSIVVTISMDLRRLWRLMRIWYDNQLVRRISVEITKLGGKELED